MICGEHTNEKVVLRNYYGEWLAERAPADKIVQVNNVLRGGPLDGTNLNDIPDGTIVMVGSSSEDDTSVTPVVIDDSPEEEEETAPGSRDDIINAAVNWAVKIAQNNEHGYSQNVRWGPSYDCSSLVISAWEQAGVPVKSKGATYTGNMRSIFMSCGFAIASGINLKSGSGLKTGDVLLNDASHTAMYIGNGKVVHARSSEGTADTADNSGNEIRVQPYWNYPWNCVLRYK